MKKLTALVLAALLTLSLAACGKDNASPGNDQSPAASSALNLLETVWNTYGEDEKFAAVGGDFSEANMKEDAPGVFDLKDRALADSELGLRDNIMQRQWMCGFPDKLTVAVVDEYVVTVFGAEELVDDFMSHLNGIYGVTAAYDEAIL